MHELIFLLTKISLCSDMSIYTSVSSKSASSCNFGSLALKLEAVNYNTVPKCDSLVATVTSNLV